MGKKMLTSFLLVTKIAKNSTKSRFITTSPKHSLKPISKSITAVFKIFHHIKSYNSHLVYISEINPFWAVLKNWPAIKVIDNINRQSTVGSVPSIVFSILYTNICSYKLIKLICELIDFCFKASKGYFLPVDKQGAKWAT